MATILVVGGAGYIGSHMVKTLKQASHEVIVLDDLSNGHESAVPDVPLIVGDMGDSACINQIFEQHQIDAVMFFASFIQVGESVKHPSKYYDNNVAKVLVLLDAMRVYGVKYAIFSSTAAIYGNPQYTPIDEAHPQLPTNPYGHTKMMIEQILQDYDKAYGLRSICLRYFNAAGADPEGGLGELHDPETHLIPLCLQTAAGLRDKMYIFGNDYPTPDGTCVRDFIHVSDLADAHLLALEHLFKTNESAQYNLGTGFGYTVQEVIETARHVTQKDIAVEYAERRAGDPVSLVADPGLARKELGWTPKYDDLATIIEHAWQFQCSLQTV